MRCVLLSFFVGSGLAAPVVMMHARQGSCSLAALPHPARTLHSMQAAAMAISTLPLLECRLKE
jgi:hypothetical protein